MRRPEELYDVEEVLGRDASSVFPTRAKADAAKARQLTTEAIQEMIGVKKFVTEKEVCAVALCCVVTGDHAIIQLLQMRTTPQCVPQSNSWQPSGALAAGGHQGQQGAGCG
jgi:hypothetical protein